MVKRVDEKQRATVVGQIATRDTERFYPSQFHNYSHGLILVSLSLHDTPAANQSALVE